MIRSLSVEETLDRIDELLEARFGSASLGNKTDPLDELVFILLSIQTQASGFTRSYDDLRRNFPSWRSVLNAAEDEVLRILKPSGLGRQKTHKIQTLLRLALDGAKNAAALRGANPDSVKEPSLSFLSDLADEQVERYLLSLPGVGPKTARCVMMYSLGRNVFPVDVNVYRVITRLGILPSLSRKRAHDPFQNAVPARFRYRLHVNLVHFGRETCKPKRGNCQECVLISFCKTGRSEHSKRRRTEYLAVDLFSGAGVLSAGFRDAGWRIVLGVENARNPAQTYRYNHPGTPVFETDVERLTAADIVATTGLEEGRLDALIGGPPCQGYSAAGKRKPHSPMNYLYRRFCSLARLLGTRAVVMENVPGMQRVNGKRFTGRVLAHFRRAGFDTAAFLLNASSYGAPQLRKRLIFLGTRKDLGFKPLAPPPLYATPGMPRRSLPRPPTVSQVLRRLPNLDVGGGSDLMRFRGDLVFNHRAMNHGRAVIKKMAKIRPGKGPISYRRLNNSFARTLVAGHRALPVHPAKPRTITVREAARIQTIPDWFRFLGPRSEQPLQVANAVPYTLASELATCCRKLLSRG
jgi:DNA (cytosine-5)-methyltransferase 1